MPKKNKNKNKLPGSMYHYSSIPSSHKAKWHVSNDVGGSVESFAEIISWIRDMASYQGSKFEGIRSCHSPLESNNCPLLEVEVITSLNYYAKFLIKKSDLYVIACSTVNCKFQFRTLGDLYLDSTFTMLNSLDGSYDEDKPWELVGPKTILNAVAGLHHMENQDINSESGLSEFYLWCQVFFVHLSEAARFKIIERFISDTLVVVDRDANDEVVFENPTYSAEADLLFQTHNGGTIDPDNDIYKLVKAKGHFNSDLEISLPSYFGTLIKSYSSLCQFWYIYSLSEGKIVRMDVDMMYNLNIRSIKTLRSILGILTMTNLNKILFICEKHMKNDKTMTNKDFKDMCKRVEDLYKENKARNLPYNKALGC